MNIIKKKKISGNAKEEVQIAQESIPEGWIEVKEGRVIIGDRLWLSYGDRCFSEPCGKDGFIAYGGEVKDKWCVIRKRPKPSVAADDSRTSINKVIKAAIK